MQREVGPDGKPGDRYTLTHKGTMIAKLGEPVFLYLRLADGWMKPVVLEEPPPPEETEDPTPPENDL